LAHVLRHDYLVNIFQSVVETLLFYHPAVWWISKQIRKEREHCCDDLAVGVSGDSLGYAKALSLLAEHRSSLPAVVLGANGGALAMRIKRLLGCQDSPSFSRLAAVVLMATTFLTVGLGIGAAVRADSSTGAVIDGNKNSRDLPAQYQRWLNEDVRWIITPEERAAFSQLSRNEERDKFVVQFWLRRSPTPDTAENKFKEEHYRRLAYANTHFAASAPGWNTDRGRTYIVHGPPDEIDAHPGHNGEKPTEIWRYYSIRVNEPPDQPGAGGQVGYRAKVVDKKNVDMKFVDVCNCGDYRLESAPVE
jgi:GWxTD domain-containing protein